MDRPSPNHNRTLVIGAGNVLRGDDGVGVRVAQALAQEPLPEGVEVLDVGTRGLDLLFEFEDADRVVLIDAAEMGQTPGEARVFDAALLEGDTDIRLSSLHGIGIAEVLALGRAVGVEPRMTIVGIQPADLRPREGLSETLSARLPEYVALARGKLAAAREP
jgi:hydrogenase maturation protease